MWGWGWGWVSIIIYFSRKRLSLEIRILLWWRKETKEAEELLLTKNEVIDRKQERLFLRRAHSTEIGWRHLFVDTLIDIGIETFDRFGRISRVQRTLQFAQRSKIFRMQTTHFLAGLFNVGIQVKDRWLAMTFCWHRWRLGQPIFFRIDCFTIQDTLRTSDLRRWHWFTFIHSTGDIDRIQLIWFKREIYLFFSSSADGTTGESFDTCSIDVDRKALIGIESSSFTSGRRRLGSSFIWPSDVLEVSGELVDDEEATYALIGNDRRWVTMGRRYWFDALFCSSAQPGRESHRLEGRVLIESTPVTGTLVNGEHSGSEVKRNDPSCVDRSREEIASTTASICSQPGASRHGWARCSSSNSFSLVFNFARSKAKTREISYRKQEQHR